MKDENKSPVTLEAMLRLKRVERPPADFWVRFDRELRAKQLAAIVEKRPWWHSLPRVHAAFSRHRVALGAAAAVAMTLFSFNEFHASRRDPSVRSGDAAYASTYAVAPVAAPMVAPATRSSAMADDRAVAAKVSDENFGEDLASVVSPPMPTRSPTPVSTRADPLQSERDERLILSPARSITIASLAAMQSAEPELMRNVLGLPQGFQAPFASSRPQITEPLAQMTPPSEERRSRVLAEALPMMASFESAPQPASEDVVSHLSDDRLSESISRYGVGGDRLSIKF